jgi:hypothetical protein
MSVAMKETNYLRDNESIEEYDRRYSAMWDAWDAWSDEREVAAWGICPFWKPKKEGSDGTSAADHEE